ncbi:MAG: response regulator transcription factor [Actinocatenispora sp.]
MIRLLLAQRNRLLRALLAAFLSHEDDFTVVGELTEEENMTAGIRRRRPDVVVADYALLARHSLDARRASHRLPRSCRYLVLMDHQHSSELRQSQDIRLGFLASEVRPQEVVDAIRRLCDGQRVLHPDLAVAALTARNSPLTRREAEVLSIAANGMPVSEIADRLCLTAGTVRNYLSRGIGKLSARTRIEAIHIAREAGWIR